MNTKDVIYELRTKKGLSQDELAEKVFVTRQAVSRWENGETVPNTETLKRLSDLFNVSINTLLGSPQKLICQCCGMPLEDEIIGRNQDGTLNENYCKWCYADGTYTYSDMDELIDVCVKHMVSDQFTGESLTVEQARAYLKQSPVMILDDSVSAVDLATEETILDNIREKRAGRTTVVIASRVSTVAHLSRIIVLADGKLEAFDTHENLMKISPTYQKMVYLQELEKEVKGGAR